LDAGACASPSYGTVTVSNTGQTPLDWTAASDDTMVSATPPSGSGVTQGSPQTVGFTGMPTGTTVHVTFTNSADALNHMMVTITCT
jgi:hypothetical protein